MAPPTRPSDPVCACRMYPNCNVINFGNWLLLCFPVSVVMLLLTWLWLYWLFIGSEWVCSANHTLPAPFLTDVCVCVCV